MSSPPLSFQKATFAGDPAPPDACAYCHRELPGQYFRVSGHLACEACARQAESLVPPDSHKAFSRALLFGALAAVTGCIAYALFEITTGIMLGWAAIAVGFAVGWAMRKGSRGLGGRRYQVAAALLTYAAVAVAFIPVALHELHDKKQGQTQTQSQSNEANDAKSAENKASGSKSAGKPVGFGGFFGACALLLGLGLVSPFLMLASNIGSGLLNLFIIFIGIQRAWKHMESPPVSIEGPYMPPDPA